MTGMPDDGGGHTHVGEWADLIGDDVPEFALRERTLADPLVPPREEEGDRPGAS